MKLADLPEEQINDLANNMRNAISIDTEYLTAKAEYDASKDSCLFETRDLLRQMQEDSKKESKYQHCVNIILIALGVLTLVATAVPIIISLLQ